MRLGRGGSNSSQSVYYRNFTAFSQFPGQNFRLIEFPLTLPRREKRYRNQRVEGSFPDALICQSLTQKPTQNRGQGEFTTVLQAMDHFAHDAPAFPTGHGVIEMEITVAAVRANKRPERSPKGTGTDRAARRSDRLQVRLALRAQVLAADRAQAPGAVRREKEIPERLKPDPARVEHWHGEDTTRRAPR